MPVTTDEIKLFLSDPARVEWLPAERSDLRDMACKPKMWRRYGKAKFAQIADANNGNMSSPTAYLSLYSQHVEILDPREITDDCVMRWFMSWSDELDCLVITDTTDQQLLRVCWHAALVPA